MNRRVVIPLLLAAVAVLVAPVIIAPHKTIMPGKLIDAHAELSDDCFACHTPFTGTSAAKCITCHKVAEIGLKTTTGLPIAKEKKNVAFHQQLIEDDCVACHSDHRGVQAFRPIGTFSHRLLDPAQQQQCTDCHANPGDALHQKVRGNCSACHTQEAWTPATFDHDRYFRFDRHHDAECATCHINNDYSAYTCYGCHEHSRSRIRGEHVEEGIYDFENCVECHRSGDEHEAEYRWRSQRSGERGSRSRREEHEHGERDDD